MTAVTPDGLVADGADPQERFEAWRELITLTRDSETSTPYVDRFAAELRRMELGAVTFLGSSFPSARFHRTDARVRRSDLAMFHLTLVLGGEMALSRPGLPTVTFAPGDITVLDSSRPYDMRAFGVRQAGSDRPRVEAIGIDIPISLLPLAPHRLRDLLGRRYRPQSGTAALIPDFLRSLSRQADVLGPAAGERIGPIAVDLVTAWLAEESETPAALSPTARRRALIENVRAFVRRNLHDPGLTPSVVAAAHHISVSYLHRVFTEESDGETLAAWIRRRRLERAHRDLADPALHGTPIHVVAARWGIPRPDDFSRAFRAAYGLSPRDHRHRSLTAAESTPCQ